MPDTPQIAKISFEFFPPRTPEAKQNLLSVVERLNHYEPDFFSVTFGAGGTTQTQTQETIALIQAHTQSNTAPHISCIGTQKSDIKRMIQHYQSSGVKCLVVLRGDTPDKQKHQGDFLYASELVAFIREQTGEHFHLSIAAYPEYHPQSTNPNEDLQHFINKAKQGANQAITQYFFNPDAYFYFVDSCQENGLNIPIVPGIMPITNYKQLSRFSDMCQAEIPRWIREKLAYYDGKGDMIGLREFGEQVVTLQCETLLNNGAPGLHFYTLNKFEPSHHILQNLMLASVSS